MDTGEECGQSLTVGRPYADGGEWVRLKDYCINILAIDYKIVAVFKCTFSASVENRVIK